MGLLPPKKSQAGQHRKVAGSRRAKAVSAEITSPQPLISAFNKVTAAARELILLWRNSLQSASFRLGFGGLATFGNCFVSQRFSAKVCWVFRCFPSYFVSLPSHLQSWRPYVAGDITTYSVDCTHHEMLTTASLSMYGEQLKLSLEA
jgi:hypothetical protein